MLIPRPTTRLLALLELLQARDRVSGAELARRLEINGRSVRRCITMLEAIGIPVEAARGRAGGYRLRPGYRLPPLLFTDEEAVVLALALRGLPRLGLRFDPSALLGLEAKLARVLPVALGERVRALETGIAFESAGILAATVGEMVWRPSASSIPMVWCSGGLPGISSGTATYVQACDSSKSIGSPPQRFSKLCLLHHKRLTRTPMSSRRWRHIP